MMRKLSYLLNIDTLRIAYFTHFQSLINYRIFWGAQTITRIIFLIHKRIRIMLGRCPMRYCRGGFKKLDILTVASLYIFALMCVVRNPEHSSTHCKDKRQKSQLHLPSVKFSSVRKGVTYSSTNKKGKGKVIPLQARFGPESG